jgi:trimeric autotransporter adhesin
MTHSKRKRIALRPSVNDQKLEDRVLLSGSGTASAAPQVVLLTPAVTPAAATTPKSPAAVVRAVRTALRTEFKSESAALRKTVDADIKQLYANGRIPSAQAKADFAAEVDGAVDAIALGISAPASLLPGSANTLVPTLQSELLGSSAGSLASRLAAVTNGARANVSAAALTTAVNQAVNSAATRTVASTNVYLSTAPLNHLSVVNGQYLPLQQYMGNQVISQLENNLGLLAQTYPTVANAMLFPTTASTGTGTNLTATTGTTGINTSGSTSTTGTTGTTATLNPTLLGTFNTQVNNALGTVAYVLGSELALFPGSSSVVSQLDSALFGGSSGTSGATGTTTNPTSSAVNSLATALANLQYGATGSSQLSSAVTSAFTTGLQNLVTPLSTFLNVVSPADLALSTSNFSNPYASGYATPAFAAGFNNGFVTTTGTGSNSMGFVGFGVSPTLSTSTYNTNFGTGFSNLVNLLDTSAGFPSTGSSLLSTGYTTTGQSLLTTTGTTSPATGLTSIGTSSPGQTTLGTTGTSGQTTNSNSLTTVATTSPGQTTTSASNVTTPAIIT